MVVRDELVDVQVSVDATVQIEHHQFDEMVEIDDDRVLVYDVQQIDIMVEMVEGDENDICESFDRDDEVVDDDDENIETDEMVEIDDTIVANFVDDNDETVEILDYIEKVEIDDTVEKQNEITVEIDEMVEIDGAVEIDDTVV